MSHLTRHDYSTVLAMLERLEPLTGGRDAFLRATLQALADVVAYERARVSLRVPPAAGSPAGRTAAGCVAHLRLATGTGHEVGIELVRAHGGFSSRDRERLALLQPHLAYLYRQAGGPPPRPAQASPLLPVPPPRPVAGAGLTRREIDVMDWLACGKTDADIGVLLAISTRTVHKHLEHIYEKLGVETRTAAVMAMRRTAGTRATRT